MIYKITTFYSEVKNDVIIQTCNGEYMDKTPFELVFNKNTIYMFCIKRGFAKITEYSPLFLFSENLQIEQNGPLIYQNISVNNILGIMETHLR